jgi:hypothetical protein
MSLEQNVWHHRLTHLKPAHEEEKLEEGEDWNVQVDLVS